MAERKRLGFDAFVAHDDGKWYLPGGTVADAEAAGFRRAPRLPTSSTGIKKGGELARAGETDVS